MTTYATATRKKGRFLFEEDLYWRPNPNFTGPTLDRLDPFLEGNGYTENGVFIIPKYFLKHGREQRGDTVVGRIWRSKNKKRDYIFPDIFYDRGSG